MRQDRNCGAFSVTLALALVLVAPAPVLAQSDERPVPAAQVRVRPAIVPQDVAPPLIEVVPPEPVREGETLRLQATVTDASGVDSVTVWARGEQDQEFRGFDMRYEQDDRWAAALESWPGRGRQVVYFVEARDKQGNGPSRAGSPRTPFSVEIEAGAAEPQRFGLPGYSLELGGLVFLLALYGFLYSRSHHDKRARSHRRDHEFWRRLLDPLFDVAPGKARNAAIDRLCTREHQHPELGTLMVSRDEVLRRLKALQHGPRLARPTAQPTAPQPGADAAEFSAEQIEEDIFWFRMLSPLRDMDLKSRDQAFLDLSSRPQHHPARGKQFFNRVTLQQEFQRIRRMSQEQLQERLRAARQRELDAQNPEVEQAEPAATVVATSLPRISPQSVALEKFWYELLAPVLELPAAMQRFALDELSGRPQLHPFEGHRLFDRKVIEREFAWVRAADHDLLQQRWASVAPDDDPDVPAAGAFATAAAGDPAHHGGG